MFVHSSIHYPRPEHEADLIASMHRFGAAVAEAPGLREPDVFLLDEV